MDEFKTMGYWGFVDDNDDYPYTGNLIVNEKLELSLLDCDKSFDESFSVYGLSVEGKKITLLKCYISEHKFHLPGFPTLIISPSYCFIGENVDSETTFKKTTFNISFLNNWLGIRPFEISWDNTHYNLNYTLPDPIIFYTDKNVTFKISFTWSGPSFPLDNVYFKQTATVIVEHKEGFNLDVFWTYLSTIKSFFTLAYFSEPKIENIKFNKKDSDIDILFTYLGLNENKKQKAKTHDMDFLFTYRYIQEDFKNVFSNWMALNEKARPVISSMQEAFASRTILIESKFLNIIQAIETFHRRFRPNDKQPKTEHKKKLDLIIDAVPSEYKEWLNEKLHFSNEPSLHERLVGIFKEISPIVLKSIFDDYEELIKKIKNSRNYYTHYDKSLEKKALKNRELFDLTERLRILLLILLLKETGISDDNVTEIIDKSSKFMYNHLILK